MPVQACLKTVLWLGILIILQRKSRIYPTLAKYWNMDLCLIGNTLFLVTDRDTEPIPAKSRSSKIDVYFLRCCGLFRYREKSNDLIFKPYLSVQMLPLVQPGFFWIKTYENLVKLSLVILTLEIVIVGYLIYRRFSKKTEQEPVSDPRIQKIQKELREIEAENRRAGFKRVK